MNYIAFQNHFSSFVVFSTQDIAKAFSHFNRMNLVHWQKKGYIRKIRNNWYTWDSPLSESELFRVANKIYAPSYISMEKALEYYGFIPEGVFRISSVTTLKTQSFSNPAGHFKYYHVKPELYFGYHLRVINGMTIRMAGPEKLLLDYLYLHPKCKEFKDFSALRLNKNLIQEKTDRFKLNKYLTRFNSPALHKRAQTLMHYIYD